MSWRVGVHIGGTVTDVVLADEATAVLAVGKVPKTPRDSAAVRSWRRATFVFAIQMVPLSLVSCLPIRLPTGAALHQGT